MPTGALVADAQLVALSDSNGDPLSTTSGAGHTVTQAGSVWAYGNWPNTLYSDSAGDAGALTDGINVYESSDISIYNYHVITMFAGAGADTCDVYITHDGSTYESVQVQLIDMSLVPGAVVQGTNDIKAAGNYILDAKVRGFKITQEGASISTAYECRVSHSVK